MSKSGNLRRLKSTTRKRLRRNLFRRLGRKHPCAVCGVEMVLEPADAPNSATLGHIDALWLTADNDPRNIRLECLECNGRDSQVQSEDAIERRRIINEMNDQGEAHWRPFAALGAAMRMEAQTK